MSVRFFDTSILYPLYDVNDPDAAAALALFEELLRTRERPHLTVNVLGELFTTMTRRRARGTAPLFRHADARERVARVAAPFEVHAVTAAHWASAMRIKETTLRDYPIWDALHWAAAKELGCSQLLTLDPPGGRSELEGVRFVNPFKA